MATLFGSTSVGEPKNGRDDDVLVSGEREPILRPGEGPLGLDDIDIPDGGDDELFGGGGNDRLIVTADSSDVRINGAAASTRCKSASTMRL